MSLIPVCLLCICLPVADGVALGAAVASSQVSVQVIVFFAVILHKVRHAASWESTALVTKPHFQKVGT